MLRHYMTFNKAHNTYGLAIDIDKKESRPRLWNIVVQSTVDKKKLFQSKYI